MTVHNQTRHMLRGAALSVLLLLAAAPAALADPPGYLFQDFAQSMPRVASVPSHQIDSVRHPAASPFVAGPDGTPSRSDQAQLQGGQPAIR